MWWVALFPNIWLRRAMAGTCVILVIGCCLRVAGLLMVNTQYSTKLDRSLQSQIIQEELDRTPKLPKLKKEKRSLHQKTIIQAKSYLKLFLETSSIHGLNHLVAFGRHPFEILLWLTTVIFSVYGALSLSQTTWVRYQSSPTVVSMDRDMYAWNTTFPCVTVCPTEKLNLDKVKTFVENFENNEKDNINKTELQDFLISLANANYRTFKNVVDYDGIAPEKYMDIILDLSGSFEPSLTIGVLGIMLNIVPTITEMGLCYAVNSKTAIYNSPNYRKGNRWDEVKNQNKTLDIHPLDGEVFAQVMNLSTGYDVYIHGPQEFPDIATKSQHSDKGYYMKLYVTAMTVYTAPDAAGLSVPQRRCRFPRENNLQHNSVYSYNLCRMECRIRLCLKHCGCVPHFYRTIGVEKICDASGLKCLAKYEDELFMLQDKTGKKINCGCFPLCDDVNYVLQSNVLQKWFLGTNLQWGMVTYPRMRYRRDIIFGFTDVLVAVGGMAGLFLGCSVLSFMEIVYFLTLRLICYARDAHKS